MSPLFKEYLESKKSVEPKSSFLKMIQNAKDHYEPIPLKLEILPETIESLDSEIYFYSKSSTVPVRVKVKDFIYDLPEKPVERFKGSFIKLSPLEYASVYLRNHLGGLYYLIITEFYQKDDQTIIKASRKKASKEIIRNYFFNPEPTDNLKAGDKIEGIVVSVFKKLLIVETLGTEIKIPVSDASYFYNNDLREIYRVGQKVKLKLKSFESDSKSNKITNLKVSLKEVNKDPRGKLIQKYNLGDLIIAKIIQKNEDNLICRMQDQLIVYVYSDNLTEKIGTEIPLKIVKIDPQKFMIKARKINPDFI